MPIARSAKKTQGRPSSSAIYRRCFIKRVHVLLAAGYAQLVPATLSCLEETTITGLLVQAIREFIEGPSAPKWAWCFVVHDDRPINKQGLGGKSRPRIDIEMERTQKGRHPRFQFEAKRLYRSDSVSEYLGDRGLGSFLSETYAKEWDDAGMVGYVQAETPSEWAWKVGDKMRGCNGCASREGPPTRNELGSSVDYAAC